MVRSISWLRPLATLVLAALGASCGTWPTPDIAHEVDSTGDFLWPPEANTLAVQTAGGEGLEHAVDSALSLYHIKRSNSGPVLLKINRYAQSLELTFSDFQNGRTLFTVRTSFENRTEVQAIVRYSLWRFFKLVELEKKFYKPENHLQPHRFIGRHTRRAGRHGR